MIIGDGVFSRVPRVLHRSLALATRTLVRNWLNSGDLANQDSPMLWVGLPSARITREKQLIFDKLYKRMKTAKNP
jgi:hypothetical protein